MSFYRDKSLLLEATKIKILHSFTKRNEFI